MAGRPPDGRHDPIPGHRGPLLDIDDHEHGFQAAHASSAHQGGASQHPPANDPDHLQSRTSTSYDEFVGSQHNPPSAHHAQAFSPYGAPQPGFTHAHSNFSQSSGLQNYQRYSDFDDLPDDEHGYYQAGADGEFVAGGSAVQGGRMRGRNSVLSMGGGILGKAKSALGMGPKYSEMDLPLTEGGQRITDVETAQQEARKTGGSTFKFGIRRGKPDPSTLGPRMIHLNNPPANAASKFVDNHISTAKYNAFTFLPKFLFEQFSKYANLFFLFTAGLQQIPGISPTNRFTTIVPLCIVLLVSAGKELIEDFKRKNSDKSLNHSQAKVLRGTSFESTRWVNVAVGDIVRVESEESFPADLVLVASSEPEGLCYIETANLDGETNLKIKQAIPETANLVNSSELSRLTGRVRSEQPNSSLYTYEATLTMQAAGGEKELPLNPDQLLLRGATLRNTPWIYGVVVFTGHETKLMRNATATPIKRTAVERRMNVLILLLVAILLVLSIVSSVGDIITRATRLGQLSYLFIEGTNNASQFFSDILTYWVLYSNLVPISLFVTVEIVKYWQAILISSDLDIYHDKTDTPAICRTSSLVEELGQIEYIFSDKTGTLTCNVMEFKQCSIGGIQYSEDVPEDKRPTEDGGPGIHDFRRLQENMVSHPTSDAIHHFLSLLATCHTVIPEQKSEKPGEIKYQAASPDEGALVEGAVAQGYRFVARKPRAVMVDVKGEEFEYELLAVCEFNSTRKRMSTIFRCPDGKVRIYCKGADTVILERLSPHHNAIVDVTLQHLEDYATEGLRTLCLAMREVPEEEFQQWWRVFEKASTTVGGNRADELDKAAEIVERDLTLLGATAIEDKLQDGVPDTIHTLQTAGIKVWVLTGDRQETAINIGMSCKLLGEDMSLLIVNEESKAATRDNIHKKLSAVKAHASSGDSETLALVIDGKSLTFALEKDLDKAFLDLAVQCKAVICWYVHPVAVRKRS